MHTHPKPPAMLGRTIIVIGLKSNGSDEQPAIVTRDWGGSERPLVNATVLPDCGPPIVQGSIYHQDDGRACGVAWRFPDEERRFPRG